MVLYQTREGGLTPAQVVSVHFETVPPYYTILCDGVERQTEGVRLQPLEKSGTPPVAAAPVAAASPPQLPRTQSVAVAPLREPPTRPLGRSPSAPVLPPRSSFAAVPDAGAQSDRRPLSDELLQARRALLEPASYEFTQYLRSLWRRWPWGLWCWQVTSVLLLSM